MRGVNITAGIGATLSLAMLLGGRDSTYGIYTQGVGAYPNAGQIDFDILLPASVVIVLLLFAWVCNIWRLQRLLFAISVLSIGALLPYFMVLGGGM